MNRPEPDCFTKPFRILAISIIAIICAGFISDIVEVFGGVNTMAEKKGSHHISLVCVLKPEGKLVPVAGAFVAFGWPAETTRHQLIQKHISMFPLQADFFLKLGDASIDKRKGNWSDLPYFKTFFSRQIQ